MWPKGSEKAGLRRYIAMIHTADAPLHRHGSYSDRAALWDMFSCGIARLRLRIRIRARLLLCVRVLFLSPCMYVFVCVVFASAFVVVMLHDVNGMLSRCYIMLHYVTLPPM